MCIRVPNAIVERHSAARYIFQIREGLLDNGEYVFRVWDALTFPGEIFEHIFTSLVRVSLPDADSGGRVPQYVATYGIRTMSLMVKAIQPVRYDIILAWIIYCCTNGTTSLSPRPTCIRLSPLDFLASVPVVYIDSTRLIYSPYVFGTCEKSARSKTIYIHPVFLPSNFNPVTDKIY